MNQLYNIDEAIAFVMSSIGTSTHEDKTIFRNWTVLGLRQIGPDKADVKVAKIVPNENGLVKKPDDFTFGLDLSLFNSSGQELKYTVNHGGPRIHIDRNVIHDTSVQDATTGRVYVSEDTYYYHISNGEVGYVLLRYFSYPVDADGLPMIREEDMIAIMAFCRWMWSLRKNDNRSEIDQNYDTWLREMDRAKGRRKLPDQITAKGIFSRWLSLVNHPNESSY